MTILFMALQSFDFDRTWWMLFQKRALRTKYDTYVFISTETGECEYCFRWYAYYMTKYWIVTPWCIFTKIFYFIDKLVADHFEVLHDKQKLFIAMESNWPCARHETDEIYLVNITYLFPFVGLIQNRFDRRCILIDQIL